STRILDQIRMRRSQQVALTLAEINQPGLVNDLRCNGPDVRKVELLKAVACDVAKSWQIRPAGHERGEGLIVEAVIAVIIQAKLLLTREVLIQAECQLILADLRVLCSAKDIAPRLGKRNELVQQIGSG